MDPRAEKYDSWSPYNYCINNPIALIDPIGDTITLSYAFKNDEKIMEVYNAWTFTDAGKAFLSRFGVGGEFEHVSINFDYKSLRESGSNRTSIVNKGTGEVTPYADGENLGKEGVDAAFGKNNMYVKSDIVIARSTIFTGYDFAGKAYTFTHELQHLRLNHYTLSIGIPKIMEREQHLKMSVEDGDLYNQRSSVVKQLRSKWLPHYQKRISDYKNEKNYIDAIINSFSH